MSKIEQRIKQVAPLVAPPVTRGNRIEILVNGDRIFPAMLRAIEEARDTIQLLTFVYWSGKVAKAFAVAIAEKAKQGVVCHVLLDALGAHQMDQELINLMRDSGARVAHYNAISIGNLLNLHHRTHRKILVVDRAIGFTGGVGIADEWQGDARNEDEWHDVHFRVTGPAVAQLFNAFADNWNEIDDVDDEIPMLDPDSAGNFPIVPMGTDLEHSGAFEGQAIQSFFSSPRDGHFEAYEVYKAAIETAERCLYIENAYFVPNDETIELLKEAHARGVEIQIILPDAHNDSWMARTRSRSSWGDLLEVGIQIFRYLPTMTHSKFMIVDNDWVTAGSVNFDTVSFRVNEESNINVFSDAFASRMHEIFAHDRDRSRPIRLEEWRDRGLWKRTEEAVAQVIPVPA